MKRSDPSLMELQRLRAEYKPGSRKAKLRLMERLSELTPTSANALKAYHEVLLFLVAFADDESVHRAANEELRRLARVVEKRFANASALDQSGIANSRVEHLYSLTASQWLATRFPADVSVVWDDTLERNLEAAIPAVVPPMVRDGLNAGITVEEWLNRMARSHSAASAGWLIEQFTSLPGSFAQRDWAWEQLDLSLAWQLRGGLSRTSLRFPSIRSPHGHKQLTKQLDLKRLASRSAPSPCRLTRAQTRQLLDTCRATCLVRSIETDPSTYASEKDLALYSLERGVDVALLGMEPERRLPLESYIGYVVAKNGVPVGYGGGWLQFDQCAIGVHVFDTFRGGEAAYLFGQVLRVYKQRFSVKRFTVDPYQIGAGNPDGIRSGAFWFYYRLGFRPVAPELVALADREWQSIRADREYRTPAKILRRFAADQLALSFGASEAESLDFTAISLRVAEWIGTRFDGDYDAARRWALRHAKKVLGLRDMSRWPEYEYAWFAQMCLILAMIPDLSDWSQQDKRSFVTALRAKGGESESDYIRHLQKHPRMKTALRALAANSSHCVAS